MVETPTAKAAGTYVVEDGPQLGPVLLPEINLGPAPVQDVQLVPAAAQTNLKNEAD